MSRTDTNPLEHVLRLIAAMAPRPWYPRVYARDYGVSLEDLNENLRVLWDAGLVVKADSGSASTGAGLQLSLAGVRMLDNPEGLRRLSAERSEKERRPTDGRRPRPEDDESLPEALPASGTAQQIRAGLERKTRPLATRILLALNAALFLLGLAVAAQRGGSDAAVAFCTDFEDKSAIHRDVLHELGGVSVADLQAGQWWRLLSSCFVHANLLHLGINLFVLLATGRRGEQVWGWWRFLLLYLLAGLSGNLVALTQTRSALPPPGASYALCGILAGELLWVLLNGRYLPRDLANRWRGGLLFNALMIGVFCAVLARPTWKGYIGAAIVGAAVAGVLNVEQYGRASWRWAFLLLLLLLPVGGGMLVAQARKTNPEWGGSAQVAQDQGGGEPNDKPNDKPDKPNKKPDKGNGERTKEEENSDFEDTYLPRISKVLKTADRLFDTEAKRPLETHPTRRAAKAKLEEIISHLEEQREEMQKLAEEIGKVEPYKASKVAERGRVTGEKILRANAGFFEVVITCLRDGKDPKDVPEYAKREKALDAQRYRWKVVRGKQSSDDDINDFEDNYLPRINKAWKGADLDFDKEANNLLKLPPDKRPPQEQLDKVIANLEQHQAEMRKLADELSNADSYEESTKAEKARVTATDFLEAYADFLKTAISCLRDAKDPKDVPEYAKREKKLKEMRSAWKSLLQ
jgi:membrane associated rhomboid family serine protease